MVRTAPINCVFARDGSRLCVDRGPGRARVLRIGEGDGVDRRALLFIKPTEIRVSTNMQVVTKRLDGSNRSYQFRLLGLCVDRGPGRARVLRIGEGDGVDRRAFPSRSTAMLEPIEVSDNGRQTAFRFPGNMRVPTIYTAAPDIARRVRARRQPSVRRSRPGPRARPPDR
jgi:hypothetical protein